MAEGKLYRLAAVAKEIHTGRDTIVKYLTEQGFEVKDSPMEKLTQDMYDMLLVRFADDKKTKEQAYEQQSKKNTRVNADESDEDEVETKILNAPIDLPVPLSAANTKSADKALNIKKTSRQHSNEESESKNDETEISKIAAPTIDGPKVIDKIDLDSSKPKRGRKKSTEDTPEQPEEKTAKTTKPKATKPEQKLPIVEAITEVEFKQPIETQKPAVVENIVARQELKGLTVVNKIELPTTPSPEEKAKKKRKRISIDKSGFTPVDNKSGGSHSGDGNRGDRRGGRNQRASDKVVSEQEVQDKIKETLARLSGGKTKNKASKYKKDKRESRAERDAERTEDSGTLRVTEFISVAELASLMDVNFTEIIAKCMNLGIMVSINQRLDAEVIELVSEEFGYKVEFINLEQEAEKEDSEDEVDAPEKLVSRPPIVTIMGHVDHGKTSLLDNIRNANVVAGEAGGITQHIGAYEVTLPSGKQITFLDTPGHEAFTAMRARGAKVTDLAIIVIAADDAVMPQTKEAINHAQAAGTNMIFAINKMDKEGANPQKIYEQLSGMNILVEEWGGKYQSQEIAAKKGLNVDKLLEKVLLEAELMDLKANPDRPAVGSVIEASLDKGRGYVATILVQNGTLRVGDMIVAGTIYGRVKAMFNERGGKVIEAGPSTPVQILGLNGAPQAGEKFKVYEDEDEAKEIANHRNKIMREQGMRTRKHITMDEIGRRLALGNFKQLNVIIKGDVDGSVEALSDSLIKLSTEEIEVKVIHKAVGQIAESDVTLATASDAIIIGFQVRPSQQAAKLADDEKIEIKFYSVIYDAINDVKNAMEGLLEPKVEQKRTCNIEIKEVFKITGVGTVAGCMVLDGKMTNKNKVNIIRDGIVIYSGEILALKRFKDDVKEVFAGMECGLSIKNYDNIQVGDIIEGFEEIEVKRTL